ncbi:MAG: dethiobiotin synthase, partial [Nitrospinaceae bacterium]
MPAEGFFITGTDTGVGKTVVTACLWTLLRKHGRQAGIMKPIETGVDSECSSSANSDAKFLLEVTGNRDPLEEVSPVRLKTPASPLQAARLDGRTLDPGLILENYKKLSGKHGLMLVEGIGGLLVPITRDYRVADLARDLGLPLIVVCRATLGTLNHTLLTLKAAADHGVEVSGVILNFPENRKKDKIEEGQAELIEELSGVKVLGEVPFL